MMKFIKANISYIFYAFFVIGLILALFIPVVVMSNVFNVFLITCLGTAIVLQYKKVKKSNKTLSKKAIWAMIVCSLVAILSAVGIMLALGII